MKHISTIAKTERKSTVIGCAECQSSCQSACKTSCTVGNQTCKQEERINNQKKNETL
ncbi:MAG: six-cysteine ranthipeptide SCIFF [Clostridia bacterium]|nr:six-cysteine ranthipeptide SCIFF [Clostridia bacterium]